MAQLEQTPCVEHDVPEDETPLEEGVLGVRAGDALDRVLDEQVDEGRDREEEAACGECPGRQSVWCRSTGSPPATGLGGSRVHRGKDHPWEVENEVENHEEVVEVCRE